MKISLQTLKRRQCFAMHMKNEKRQQSSLTVHIRAAAEVTGGMVFYAYSETGQ